MLGRSLMVHAWSFGVESHDNNLSFSYREQLPDSAAMKQLRQITYN